jgi:hypothetical protein
MKMTNTDRLPDAIVQVILDITDNHDGYSKLKPFIEELLEKGVSPRRVMCDLLYSEMMEGE